ncbi:peter pan [Echinococcus multilocularis]|uniref:Peter pan n=1 Tax=Echinococcus multilocularis TaxID=6211 RepID=A0A068Y9S3_ECHMU|nr:peter pan [Echinococcus multilocularis]
MSSARQKRRRHGRHRHRKPRSALAAAAAQERKLARAPHSFVFARPGCGSLVKTLSLDVRRVFEPFTASQLRISRRNVLKDFINIAGPLHVSHILYFTHPRSEKITAKRIRHAANLERRKRVTLKNAEDNEVETNKSGGGNGIGGVYLHLIRAPSGPSLTFRVSEYCLTRDVVTLVQKIFDVRQFSSPPLLAMTGFGSGGTTSAPPPPHLRLLVDMFQNMLPSLNIQKLKVSSVRRVLLLSREVDSCSDGNGGEEREVIYLRHYNIRLENRSISRALRRLGMGGAPLRRRRDRIGAAGLGPRGFGKCSGVPNLANYASMDDYLAKANLLTESAASELEDMAEITLPGQSAAFGVSGEEAKKPSIGGTISSKDVKEARAQAKAAHGFAHLSGCHKACVRLTEIGPRLTLQLIKIEEGVNSGAVLYHSWQKRTPQEIAQQEAKARAKVAAKVQRREEQEKRRRANVEAVSATSSAATVESDAEEEGIYGSGDDDDDDANGKLLMHQLSDEEEEDNEEEEASAVEKEVKVSKPGKRKKKTKKISRKHPAYNHLMQKAKKRKLTQT